MGFFKKVDNGEKEDEDVKEEKKGGMQIEVWRRKKRRREGR